MRQHVWFVLASVVCAWSLCVKCQPAIEILSVPSPSSSPMILQNSSTPPHNTSTPYRRPSLDRKSILTLPHPPSLPLCVSVYVSTCVVCVRKCGLCLDSLCEVPACSGDLIGAFPFFFPNDSLERHPPSQQGLLREGAREREKERQNKDTK